jgi:hypothetical protein
MTASPTTWSIVGECSRTLTKWRLTYASYKKSLNNGKATATIDLEEEDGNKGTLPLRPRGHKATKSDLNRDVTVLALSETFKGWMVYKEEAIAKRDEKRRREKEATCAQFFDLAKKAIEIEETMAKAKAMEVEVNVLAEEREIMFIDTTKMMEEQKDWVEKRHDIIQQCDT